MKARIARRGKNTSEKLGRHRRWWSARWRGWPVTTDFRYTRRSCFLGCSLVCLNYLSRGFATMLRFCNALQLVSACCNSRSDHIT